jgi:hypothetical protein
MLVLMVFAIQLIPDFIENHSAGSGGLLDARNRLRCFIERCRYFADLLES